MDLVQKQGDAEVLLFAYEDLIYCCKAADVNLFGKNWLGRTKRKRITNPYENDPSGSIKLVTNPERMGFKIEQCESVRGGHGRVFVRGRRDATLVHFDFDEEQIRCNNTGVGIANPSFHWRDMRCSEFIADDLALLCSSGDLMLHRWDAQSFSKWPVGSDMLSCCFGQHPMTVLVAGETMVKMVDLRTKGVEQTVWLPSGGGIRTLQSRWTEEDHTMCLCADSHSLRGIDVRVMRFDEGFALKHGLVSKPRGLVTNGRIVALWSDAFRESAIFSRERKNTPFVEKMYRLDKNGPRTRYSLEGMKRRIASRLTMQNELISLYSSGEVLVEWHKE